MTPTGGPLFDASQARGPRRGPDVGAAREPTDQADAKAMSVSALLARVKNVLTAGMPKTGTVVGELSNCKLHTSGHFYFRLKDADTAIDAAMFKAQASKLKFRPEDGLEVIVTGRVDVYQTRGQLQLYANKIIPKGAGALELAFRQLKEKLQGEGLFDPARKKPLPRFPSGIGVITSATGAAVRDIGRTLRWRWPAAKVYLLPAIVQGDQAASQIAAAIADLDAAAGRLGIDTLIVARGGGSLEDLWAFNEEPVARAIAAAATPVICGVGHEVDITIADMVADVRAATPTAAAERAVPDRAEMSQRIEELFSRLAGAATGLVIDARTQLGSILRSVVFRNPAWQLREAVQQLDELTIRLPAGLKGRLADDRRSLEPLANRLAALHPARLSERARARLDRLTNRLAWVLGARAKLAGDRLGETAGRFSAIHPKHQLALASQRLAAARRQLEALSYRATLQRGFSVTRSSDGTIVRAAEQALSAGRLETEFADGRVRSIVEGSAGKSPTPRRAKPDPDHQQPSLFDAPQPPAAAEPSQGSE